MDVTYGKFNVIMIGDIAQLLPVLDRDLYSPSREDSLSVINFLAYRNLDHVVFLDWNCRASSENQNELKQLLVCLQNGNIKLSDL